MLCDNNKKRSTMMALTHFLLNAGSPTVALTAAAAAVQFTRNSLFAVQLLPFAFGASQIHGGG